VLPAGRAGYREVADRELLHVDAVRLTAGIDWPTSS